MKKMALFLLAAALVSCSRPWTEKDKSEFVSGCLSAAVRGMGEDSAKRYCRCLVEKVVAKYPNANDAKYIKYDSTVKVLAQECLKQR